MSLKLTLFKLKWKNKSVLPKIVVPLNSHCFYSFLSVFWCNFLNKETFEKFSNLPSTYNLLLKKKISKNLNISSGRKLVYKQKQNHIIKPIHLSLRSEPIIGNYTIITDKYSTDLLHLHIYSGWSYSILSDHNVCFIT